MTKDQDPIEIDQRESLNSQVVSFIVQKVTERWKKNTTATNLADMGQMIQDKYPQHTLFQKGKLRQFLEEQGIVQVIRHSRQSQKIGLLPLDTINSDATDDLFPVTIRRLHPSFWSAFARPLSGLRRFVIMTGVGTFDLHEGASPPPEEGAAYEIFANDISQDHVQGSLRNQAIWNSVRSWCDRNGLNVSVFEQAKLSARRSEPLDEAQTLGRFVMSMKDEDLSRISVPLDILVKIIRGFQR